MKYSVLIVDDNLTNLRLAASVLSPYYKLLIADGGETAIKIAETKAPDLILLDVMMPGLSGYDVCSRLKQIEETKDIPIIFLTAKADENDIEMAFDAGGVDYVTKPFAFEELLARVRAVVRKAGSGRAALIKADDLEIDPVTHKVKRGGVNIDLTSKEYALLEYLARNNGKVITRTMISEHVWDIDFDTGTNIIDVYINYLRKKVDSGHSKKLIQTMRGRGYRFGL